jgi:uncharacterized protein
MIKKFPEHIPIFPLSGVIYFPKTNLPLNIFENRYLQLVNDAFNKNKLMGMIQTKKDEKEIYRVGCLGKINDFQKSQDGRIIINLTGLTRFEVTEELSNAKLYREFKVNYKKFSLDIETKIEEINLGLLLKKTRVFFEKYGLLLNWKEFDKLDVVQQTNTLAMIAPITNEEKQKLLESISLQEKIKTLTNILDFYLHEVNFNNQTIQ